MTPSWRIRPRSSRLIQPSASLPSSMRYHDRRGELDLVAGRPGCRRGRPGACRSTSSGTRPCRPRRRSWSTVDPDVGERRAEHHVQHLEALATRLAGPGIAWWSTKSWRDELVVDVEVVGVPALVVEALDQRPRSSQPPIRPVPPPMPAALAAVRRRDDADLDQQAEQVRDAPVLDDLPVLDAEEADRAPHGVLAARRELR